MPRPRKQTDLDSQLLDIAQRMTQEVAQIVRAYVGAEMSRIINGSISGIVNGSHFPAAGRRRRGGPTPQLLAAVLDTIKRSPGLRSEQLYQKIQQPSASVKAALAKLREQKKVKTSGQRRSTTYRAA